MNSFRRVVRSGVHQALDFGEGRDRGAVFSITAVSVERAEENHWSSWLGEGVSGRGGDKPVFKSVRQAWQVSFLPAWSGPVVMGTGGA